MKKIPRPKSRGILYLLVGVFIAQLDKRLSQLFGNRNKLGRVFQERNTLVTYKKDNHDFMESLAKEILVAADINNSGKIEFRDIISINAIRLNYLAR